jgi:hypothetical protein
LLPGPHLFLKNKKPGIFTPRALPLPLDLWFYFSGDKTGNTQSPSRAIHRKGANPGFMCIPAVIHHFLFNCAIKLSS